MGLITFINSKFLHSLTSKTEKEEKNIKFDELVKVIHKEYLYI